MARQAEGRIGATVFLAGLVASAGLGLVGEARHSFVNAPGDTPAVQHPAVAAGPRPGIGGASGDRVPPTRVATLRPGMIPHRRPAAEVRPSGPLPPSPTSRPAVRRVPGNLRVDSLDGRGRPLTPVAGPRRGAAIILVGHQSDAATDLPASGSAGGEAATTGGGPDIDPAAIDWPEGATGAVPPLDATPGSRRGPVATWIRDSLDDLKSARGGVVAFPQRQAGTATGGGRLIERIRSGERLLGRDRGGPNDGRGQRGPDGTGTTGWPMPGALLQQLDQLSAHDQTAAATWGAETASLLRRLLATGGPHDRTAADALPPLAEQVTSGMRLADAHPDVAPTIRRDVLGLQRRLAVWQAAVDLVQAAATRSGEDEPTDSAAPSLAESLPVLLHTLERYDTNPTPADASAIAAALEAIVAGEGEASRTLADAVRGHYAAANVRVAVHQSFIERMMPPTQVTNSPVDDTVLGRQVRGTSRVAQSTAVRLQPDADGISVVLEVRGDVASRTVTESGPVALTSRGSSSFTVHKPVTVGNAGLQVGPSKGSAWSRSQLADIQTSFDGVPIMRSLVRNIARNQHDEHYPEANREVIDKIVTRACREVDQQVEPQLLAAAERIRTQAWGPLVRLGLDPTPVSLETTGGIATARLRLAADDQLAAHTPRPRAPLGSMLSVQVHESAVNNALERLELAGRRLPLEDLIELLCDRAGVDPRVPEELPEEVAVTFAPVQPLRVHYREGVVQIRVALDAIESGRRSWHDIVATVNYRPKAESPQVFLEREGPIQLGGPGHQGRAEIALRAVFGKIFPKERPLPLLPETFVANPKLADIDVLQAVSTDGWLALSLGQLPESAPTGPTKVAAPTSSRRILRR